MVGLKPAPKHVVRKYDHKYIQLGFLMAGGDAEKGQCAECGEIFFFLFCYIVFFPLIFGGNVEAVLQHDLLPVLSLHCRLRHVSACPGAGWLQRIKTCQQSVFWPVGSKVRWKFLINESESFCCSKLSVSTPLLKSFDLLQIHTYIILYTLLYTYTAQNNTWRLCDDDGRFNLFFFYLKNKQKTVHKY